MYMYMIVENQDIRKRRLDDLKQILLRKQYPAEIIDYGVNKALTLTTEELRRVRESKLPKITSFVW